MRKELQTKRKHHHVWANYLLKWSTNNRDLFCVTSKGNINFTSVRGVVMERDFYQLTELNKDDVATILTLSSKASITLQDQHNNYLLDFLNIQKLEKEFNNSNIQCEEMNQIILAAKCNLLENLHTAHENDAAPILEELAKGNIAVLDNDREMLSLTTFLGHQITRTKNFKVCCITGLSKNNPKLGKTMEHSWWFLSYMFGMNIGYKLYSARHTENHTLLLNNTNTDFITSDQPAINVHSCIKEEEFHAPESMDLFYPISPKYAYIISESHRFENGLVEINESNVIEFNEKIAKNANEHIFSLRKQEVDSYKSLVGNSLRVIKERA